ncbi:MAG: MotA/TolQ/ExbB proton channel family protein [Pseudomonadales bacterium]
MYEIVLAGGWIMGPLLLISVAVVAIAAERYWTLNAQKIIPASLLLQIWDWLQHGQLDAKKIKTVHDSSPLGQVLAAGLSNTRHSRAVMIESMEVAAGRVQHDLERYLSALSAIANIAPLMGLLGTVIGTIKIFSAIMLEGGTGNPSALAGGISEALIATAAGLIVAIPASLASRYFYRVVDGHMISIQQDAMKLVDALHSDRKVKGEKSSAEH